MSNTNVVNEGYKGIEIVAVKVVGGYVVGELDPRGVHHQVEVKGGEVKDQIL
jgi:hypothetical protein